jgi:enoyl-CoA hydratase/carnithine racemase
MTHETPTGLEITIADGVQTLRLARAAKKNALTSAMYAGLRAALVDGDRREDVAVHVLTGSGGSFSAGSDVAEFAERAKGRTDLSGPIVDFIRYLPLVEKPLVAAVDGLAVGLGTTLLFHCDLVYATPASTFRTPFLDLGLVPEAGSSVLAPQRMGHARAFELLALGETFSAERAMAAGLVNAMVGEGELEAMAMKAALRLARKPPQALALCRRLMRGDNDILRRQIEEEARIFAERLASPEAREAFAAFLEKRTPDFGKLNRAGS